jgi:hypothetical protein
MAMQPNSAPQKPKRLSKGAVRQQTATLKKLMIEQLQKYPIVEAACHKVGISRMTHYRWVHDDKDYARETIGGLYSSNDMVNDVAVSKVIEAINLGAKWAIIFWLTHRHPQFNDDAIIRNMHKRIAKIELKEEEREHAVFELQQVIGNIVIVKPRCETTDDVKEAGGD